MSPPHKPKYHHTKYNPGDSTNSICHPEPEPPTSAPAPQNPSHVHPHKAVKKFVLRQPSVIDHLISSLDFPEIFSQSYAPPLYHTDLFNHPMNAQTLSIFMAGQLASARDRPTYDAAAVEDTQAFFSSHHTFLS